LRFPPIAAAIQSMVDAVAPHGQAIGDALAVPVEPCVHAIATTLEGGSATRVSMSGLPIRTAVEAGFHAVTALIVTSLHDRRAVVEAVLDPVTALVETLFDALAVIGGHDRAGRKQQQCAGQREGHDSHGELPVCRTTLLQVKTPAPDTR